MRRRGRRRRREPRTCDHLCCVSAVLGLQGPAWVGGRTAHQPLGVRRRADAPLDLGVRWQSRNASRGRRCCREQSERRQGTARALLARGCGGAARTGRPANLADRLRHSLSGWRQRRWPRPRRSATGPETHGRRHPVHGQQVSRSSAAAAAAAAALVHLALLRGCRHPQPDPRAHFTDRHLPRSPAVSGRGRAPTVGASQLARRHPPPSPRASPQRPEHEHVSVLPHAGADAVLGRRVRPRARALARLPLPRAPRVRWATAGGAAAGRREAHGVRARVRRDGGAEAHGAGGDGPGRPPDGGRPHH